MHDLFHSSDFWIYTAVGFFAQMVDGALGMAYGTLSTSILLSTGVPPLIVSASVHSAQFFTTGLSALSHTWFRNVNKKLLLILAVTGSLGGVGGALLLSHIDGKLIKPWVALYLTFLGLMILWKRFRGKKIVGIEARNESPFRAALGLIGGFLDALGGGWGPLVTSNLIARDEDPRLVIGTVNAAEFFVKTLIAVTFITTISFSFGNVVLGLLTGGVVAAPFGAWVLRYIQPELLMTGVGVLIVCLSGYVLVNTLI